jgi:hypothetical protein
MLNIDFHHGFLKTSKCDIHNGVATKSAVSLQCVRLLHFGIYRDRKRV